MGTAADLYQALDGWDAESSPSSFDLHPDETLRDLHELGSAGRTDEALTLIDTEVKRLRPLVRAIRLGIAEPTLQQPGTRQFVIHEFVAELCIKAARIRLQEGKFEAAREDLIAALAVHPDARDARFTMVEVYEGLGEYAQALSLLERAYEGNADTPLSLLEFGASVEKRGAVDAAAAAYRRAAALDELGNVSAMAGLRLTTLGTDVGVSVLSDRYDEAVAAFESADKQRAAESFLRVLAYDTRHDTCWFAVATALQDLAGGQRTDDDESHATYWNIDETGRAFLARAMQAYRVVLSYSTHEVAVAESLHQLANCLLLTGSPTQALTYAHRAAHVAPRDAGVIADLAQVMLLCGDLSGAVERAREALELDPTSASARITLGKALVQSGDDEGLLAEFDAVMEAIERVRGPEGASDG